MRLVQGGFFHLRRSVFCVMSRRSTNCRPTDAILHGLRLLMPDVRSRDNKLHILQPRHVPVQLRLLRHMPNRLRVKGLHANMRTQTAQQHLLLPHLIRSIRPVRRPALRQAYVQRDGVCHCADGDCQRVRFCIVGGLLHCDVLFLSDAGG